MRSRQFWKQEICDKTYHVDFQYNLFKPKLNLNFTEKLNLYSDWYVFCVIMCFNLKTLYQKGNMNMTHQVRYERSAGC